MRRVVVCGVVLICLAAVFALVRADGERILIPGGESAVNSPVPVAVSNFPAEVAVRATRTVNVTGSVAVTNFPAVQAVSGSVNVGNLPATQNVAGSVAVSNLPLDAEGNVRVAANAISAAPSPHFVGFTNQTFGSAGSTLLNMSRACHQEFPGTRLCEITEVQRAIPPIPPLPSPVAFLMVPVSGFSTVSGYFLAGCVTSSGDAAFACISLPERPGPYPAACCGF